MLRLIQFYNFGGYHVACGTEDGYAPGPTAADPEATKALKAADAPAGLTAARSLPAAGSPQGMIDLTVELNWDGAEPVTALHLPRQRTCGR